MTTHVDAGPIIAEACQVIKPGFTPVERLGCGNAHAYLLFQSYINKMERGLPPCGLQWAGTKRTRADLLEMCDLRGLDDAEKQRRKFAFQGFKFLE